MLLSPIGAEVTSDNVVGYHKINLAKGFNLVGVQFSDLDGADKDISTVFRLDDTYAGYNDDYVFSTILQVWDGNGYDTYGWAGSSGTAVDTDPSLDYTWTDNEAYAVEGVTTPSSTAMWIKAEKAGTMLISGEVLKSELVIDLMPGFNLVANPYPCAVPVSSFGQLDSTYAGYNDDYVFSTILQVWDGNGYDTYGWAGTSGTAVDTDPSLDNTWTDNEAYATEDMIPAGSGVWIKAEKAGTLTFAPQN